MANTNTDQLLADLMAARDNAGYTPKTDAEIREQATNQYKSYYDQLRLSAQQQQEYADLRYQQQADALQRAYDKQREESAEQYRSAYAQAGRTMLNRGMQRSSYGAQVQANIQQEGVEAQQAIYDSQAAALGDIEAQRTQLAQMLAQQMQQYTLAEQQDILKRIQELEDQEYERGQAALARKDSLSAQIYQYLYQQGRDAVSDAQWQQQMAYQANRDAAEDARWQQQFAYQQGRDEVADKQWQAQFDEDLRRWEAQQNKSSGGGSSSSGGRNGGSGTVDEALRRILQGGIDTASSVTNTAGYAALKNMLGGGVGSGIVGTAVRSLLGGGANPYDEYDRIRNGY